jgi:CBS domain-containing protein
MKASELMTPSPITCAPGTNLAEAAQMMLDADCGFLPVTDNGQLKGVVTDRDLFIALGTRNRLAADVTVGEVMQAPVFTCNPDDDADTVLALMKEHRIRRVPVAGFGHTVLGVVSLNDIVLAAGVKPEIHDAAIVDVLQRICAHHFPALHIAAA